MSSLLRYRGTEIREEEIRFITELIRNNPQDSRRMLSQKLCRAWDWVQPNGNLRDMVCRGLMLRLDEAGLIKLPAKRRNPPNPFVDRRKPEAIEIERTPVSCSLRELEPVVLRQVRRTKHEKLFNSLIQQYHYLGYCHPVGEQLKYIVWSGKRPVACFAFSSAPRHIGCRDRFIGWRQEIRKKNIHLMAYNTRFLILPWVGVRYLASHLLSRIARIISDDWQGIYAHGIYFLETFVDLERFTGSCYRAANWIYLGKTTGLGKDDHTKKPNRSIKAVYGYPLAKDFRTRLCLPRGCEDA